MANRLKCEVCKKLLVPPVGPAKAPILLLGEWAGYEDTLNGIPLSGKIAEILTSELGKVGIQYIACRRMNMWWHGRDEKECNLSWHLDHTMAEVCNHKLILVMGSEGTHALFDCGVMDVSGLKIKLPAFPNQIFFPMPNPTLLLHGPVGEFRLAMERFKKEWKKHE